MADKYTNNEIYLMLENVSHTMKSGFKGVHSRQDKTNGNVKKNTEYRISSDASWRTIKWIVGFIGFGTLLNIGLTILLKIKDLL